MAAALVTLALGLGANVTIFTFLNAALLGPMPFAEPERVVYLWSSQREGGGNRLEVSFADFLDWQAQSRQFENLVAFENRWFTVAGDPPERVLGLNVSAGFFSLTDATAALGRVFAPGQDPAPEVVLSHDLWRQHFGADREIVGRTIYLDREPVTVVGVMPADFWFPSQRVKLWSRLRLETASAERGAGSATVLGRLAAGASLAQARDEMEVIARRLEQAYPATNSGRGVSLVSISWELLGPSDRLALLLLGLAAAAVLLIACVNVANLLLARVLSRRCELGIRVALGAGRLRLIRQLVSESLPLGLLGGALALLLARWGADVLLAVFPPSTPVVSATLVDGRVLGYTLAAVFVSTLLFGLVPALRGPDTNIVAALREGCPGAGRSRRRKQLSRLLVVGQITLTLALLIVAGVMIRTLFGLHHMDPGFRTDGILTARIDLPREDAPVDFVDQALERISALPGILAASAVSHPPFLSGAGSATVTVEPEAAGSADGLRATALTISPGYFRTLDIPLVKGRAFTQGDRGDSLPVAVVNEALARRLWAAQEDPIGSQLRLSGKPEDPPLTVVGVVADVRRVHPAFVPRPQIYRPHAQLALSSMTLMIRTAGEPLAAAPVVRDEVARVHQDLPVYEIRELRQIRRDLLAIPSAFTGVLGVFGILALTLAAAGIYGVVSYSVEQRKHELGVRIALGAARRDLMWLVLREGLALAGAGMVIGSMVALVLIGLITSRLVGIDTGGFPIFLAVLLLLSAVALAASYLPTHSAIRAEPMATLRQD